MNKKKIQRQKERKGGRELGGEKQTNVQLKLKSVNVQFVNMSNQPSGYETKLKDNNCQWQVCTFYLPLKIEKQTEKEGKNQEKG